MSNEHIARAFDRDLEAVQAMIMRMGGACGNRPSGRGAGDGDP